MKSRIKILSMLPMALILLASSVIAAEVKFEASLDRDAVGIGERSQLGLTFYGTQSMPAPDLGNLDGLEVRYLGPSTMMTVINGRVSSSVTHMYSVLPLRTGRFQLGPYTFNYKGDKYTSNAIFLVVGEERAEPKRQLNEPAIEDRRLEDRLLLTLTFSKSTAYVNELVPVKVKFYVSNLNVRDIQLPTFGQEGFSKAEFKEPKQYREDFQGQTYDVLEFYTNIFATRPGDYKLGPAKIKCNLIMPKKSSRGYKSMDEFFASRLDDEGFDDFFGGVEKRPWELSSLAVPLVVSPLPDEGMPAGYMGAVGDFQFIFNANPKKVKIGDPITLTMEINGTGNFNTVLAPKIENTGGFKVYEPQVKTQPGTKVFTQVVIPENDKVTQTPKAVFDYFDPNKKEYKTITQGSTPIQVEKGKDEAPAQVVGPLALPSAIRPEERLTRDAIYIKDSLGRTRPKGTKLLKDKVLYGIMAFPLAFLMSIYIYVFRTDRLRQDSAYAGRIMAYKMAKKHLRHIRQLLKAGAQGNYYEALSGAVQDYLGNRLNIPPAGITYDAVDRALVGKDPDLDVMRKIKGIFSSCDAVRFANLKMDGYKMKDDMKEFEEIVKYFERTKL